MVCISIAYYITRVATNQYHLMVAAAIYGVGNGCTGGLTNVLSIDICPPDNKATFMGIWKMYTSVGSLMAPLGYGILADVLHSTDLATLLVSILALCGGLWLYFVVPEPSQEGEKIMESATP